MQPHTSSRGPLIVAGLAVLTLAAGYLFMKSAHSSPPAPDSTVQSPQSLDASVATPEQPAAEDSEPRALSPSERANLPQLPAGLQSASRPAPGATVAPALVRTEPTLHTRQLVAGLTNLDLSHGPITKEEAEQWKQGLQALTVQGAAAVPAIREFLEQNLELNFSAVSGGNLLGQTSLRSAFINGLAQIGGPEATAVLLQTLQTTAVPAEIALLAQHLEQQSPGQYRQETLNAVSQALGLAAQGQLAGWDVGTLFKVLQTYGDGTTAPAMEQLQSQWRYYATMSLAGLQGGEGVPALIRQAQDPAAGGKRDFALQMLAQVAAQYPDAGAALLEQARLNQIPDAAWRKIATGLAGDQYQIGSPPSAGGPGAASAPGLKTYHIESGNQNFYSLPATSALNELDLTQRRALIDQLLAVNSNPAAVQALQLAQASVPATRTTAGGP